MEFSNKTSLNLVIGYPLHHTLSPLLHNEIYQKLNFNTVLLAAAHENLTALIEASKTLKVGLIAVTMPFKKAILAYLDEISEEVKTLGAANTIIIKENKLSGYNTDVNGIMYAFRNIQLKNKKVLILGAGGAARAAAYVLKKAESEIYWYNRTTAHLTEVMHLFKGHALSFNQLAEETFDIIINTTPVGMYPDINDSPIPASLLHEELVVFDMVYNPRKTELLKQADQKGAIIISGLEMFVAQALKQIELWKQINFSEDFHLTMQEKLAAHFEQDKT